MSGGIPIPEGADLYTYVTPGNYYCVSDVNARTLVNCPLRYAFTLKVEYGNGFGYVRQTFKQNATNIIITRTQKTSAINYDAWSDDTYYVTTSDIAAELSDVTGSAVTSDSVKTVITNRYTELKNNGLISNRNIPYSLTYHLVWNGYSEVYGFFYVYPGSTQTYCATVYGDGFAYLCFGYENVGVTFVKSLL